MATPTTAAQLQDGPEIAATTDHQLAEYVRSKLKLAINLACNGEQERRSGHPQAAEGYRQEWESVMAEVKRLLPQVRGRGALLFAAREPTRSRSRQKGR